MQRFSKLVIVSLFIPFFLVIYGQTTVGAVALVFGLFYALSIVGFTLTRYTTQNAGITIWDPTVLLNPSSSLNYLAYSIKTAMRANLETITDVITSPAGQILILSIVLLIVGVLSAYAIKKNYATQSRFENIDLSILIQAISLILVIGLETSAIFLLGIDLYRLKSYIMIPLAPLILILAFNSLINDIEHNFTKIVLIINFIILIFLVYEMVIYFIFLSDIVDLNVIFKFIGIFFIFGFQICLYYLLKALIPTEEKPVNVLSLRELIESLVPKNYIEIISFIGLLLVSIIVEILYLPNFLSSILIGILPSLYINLISLGIIILTIILEIIYRKTIIGFIFKYLSTYILMILLIYFWLFSYFQLFLAVIGLLFVIIICFSFVNLNQYNLEERLKLVYKFNTVYLLLILSDLTYIVLGFWINLKPFG